jgi:DNA replication protein DnaC
MNAVTTLQRVKQHLVDLKMASALEVLDGIVGRLERNEISSLEALESLLAEENTLRESRRIRAQLMTSRLTNIKTLGSFDFSFQPTLDRNRIQTLAELGFIERHQTVHLLGPPGVGKSHLAIALHHPGRADRYSDQGGARRLTGQSTAIRQPRGAAHR